MSFKLLPFIFSGIELFFIIALLIELVYSWKLYLKEEHGNSMV